MGHSELHKCPLSLMHLGLDQASIDHARKSTEAFLYLYSPWRSFEDFSRKLRCNHDVRSVPDSYLSGSFLPSFLPFSCRLKHTICKCQEDSDRVSIVPMWTSPTYYASVGLPPFSSPLPPLSVCLYSQLILIARPNKIKQSRIDAFEPW